MNKNNKSGRKTVSKIMLMATVLGALTLPINSQTKNVGIGTETPNASALLDLDVTNLSNKMGLLIPRVALTGTSDNTTIASPVASLLIYNTANVSDVVQGFYYWDGVNKWIRLVTTSNPGAVPFNLLDSGTNTTANMTVGTGASLLLGGTGIVEASKIKGDGSTTDAVDLATNEAAGVLPISKGGTQLGIAPADNQLLIGKTGGIYEQLTLTAGANISVSKDANNLTIATTGLQSALTFGNITSATSGITIGNGNSAVIGTGTTVEIATASTSGPGLLSKADWDTFNSKAPGWSAQNANLIFAGPTSGGSASPAFRSLVSTDIPDLDAGKVTTGIFPINRGGTGLGTAPTNNQILVGNLGGTAYEKLTLTAGANISVSKDANNLTIATTGLQSALTFGNITSTTSGITIGNGTSAVIGTGTTVEIATASTAGPGLLSKADWDTFNSKISVPSGGNTNQYLRGDNTFQTLNVDVRAAISGTAPVTYNSTSGAIGVDVGTAANQVAAGDHTHNGVYLTAEVDAIIGNEVTNATTDGGLVRAGSGTNADQYTLGINWGGDGAANTASRSDHAHSNYLANSSYTQGQILYANNSGILTPLDAGTSGQVLKTNGAGANPQWTNMNSGTVTEVTVNSPLTIATGTTTPVISIEQNSATSAGVVASGSGKINQVWKTDASGNPDWRNDENTVYTAGTGLLLVGNQFSPDFGTVSGKIAAGDHAHTDLLLKGGYTQGDILYADGVGDLVKLAAGTDGQVLKMDPTNDVPAWSDDNNTTYTAGTGLDLTGTAFSAKNTEALWNANKLVGRNIIATGGPTAGQTIVWNETNTQWEYGNTITGTGVADRVAYFSDANTLTTGVNLLFNGFTLGIGTSALPLSSAGIKLEVRGGDILARKNIILQTVETSETPKELQFYEAAGGSDYIAFKAPADIPGVIKYTLPGAVPTDNQILSTTSTGELSWIDPPSGGSGSMPTGSTNGQTIRYNASAWGVSPAFIDNGTAETLTLIAPSGTAPDTVNAKITGDLLVTSDLVVGRNLTISNGNVNLTTSNLAINNGSISFANPVPASGAIDVTGKSYILLTSDDPVALTGGIAGQIVILQKSGTGSTATLLSDAGIYMLNGPWTMTTTNENSTITLIFDGTNWVEIARANN